MWVSGETRAPFQRAPFQRAPFQMMGTCSETHTHLTTLCMCTMFTQNVIIIIRHHQLGFGGKVTNIKSRSSLSNHQHPYESRSSVGTGDIGRICSWALRSPLLRCAARSSLYPSKSFLVMMPLTLGVLCGGFAWFVWVCVVLCVLYCF